MTMQHIDVALKKSNSNSSTEKSVLQRLLAVDNDIKTAYVLALDMFLVGIDTVIFFNSCINTGTFFNSSTDIKCCSFYSLSARVTSRKTTNIARGNICDTPNKNYEFNER